MKFMKAGASDGAAVNMTRGAMWANEPDPAKRDKRWNDRYADIPRCIQDARVKLDAEQAEVEHAQAVEEADIQPIDLWGHFEPAQLPRGLLPETIEVFARVQGEMMGADPAGLAMGALTVCAAAISDEIKLQVKQHSRGWIEPPLLWLGLLGGVSEKKSPIIREVDRPLKAIDKRLMKGFLARKAAYAALTKEQQEASEEPRRERLRIEDTTIEACQDAMRYNPRGMLAVQDEVSGWFGGMDKYNAGGKGAAKDRGFWLQCWNGGDYSVDRISRGAFIVPNIGLSVLGGVQPSVIRKLVERGI